MAGRTLTAHCRTTPGAFAGTPEFASPEQFAGVGADIRSDLYSLGVTLWNMLAGQTPFRGSSADLMHQHLHATLPMGQLDLVPQAVRRVRLQSLETVDGVHNGATLPGGRLDAEFAGETLRGALHHRSRLFVPFDHW